jgi:hypothetical protein
MGRRSRLLGIAALVVLMDAFIRRNELFLDVK